MWLLVVAYFPLGIVGLWRWTVWLIKKGYAATYRPQTGSFHASVAVITPVYNENPNVFTRALNSWKENGVDEIVAVIDYTDKKCLAIFQEFSKNFPGAKLIVTKTPGKRPALVDGIHEAKSDIVALVDSDTVWGSDVKKNALIPFQNAKVGGVSTRQSVLEPKTLAQHLFNAQLNLRYFEELPFMVAAGGTVITCISGRTGFYRRAAVLPLLDDVLHETFWGKPVISGDDKRLTYLVEAAGWKVAFQQNAQVFTPGMPNLKTYFKQRLRWARNSWRADLRTLTQPWVYKYPRFVWYLTDRVLQPFAQLISPITFLASLALGLWIPAAVLLVWWHLGRLIRMWPHLRRQPKDVGLIPIFIALNFYNSLMKIYALVTLNRQGWITRWSKERLPGPPPWLRAAFAYGVTGTLVATLAFAVTIYEGNTQAEVQQVLLAAQFRPAPRSLGEVGATSWTNEGPAIFRRHEVVSGDTVAKVAARYNVRVEDLIAFNDALLPSLTHIEVGLVLTIPPPDLPTEALAKAGRKQYSSKYEQLGPLQTTYVPEYNTIEVRGRGQRLTLKGLAKLAGEQFVQELAPREWYVNATVVLKAGVSLRLSRDEVEWLKLESGAGGAAALVAEDGQIIIDGVRVTSWDNARHQVDMDVSDGRSFITARGMARLDIVNSELAYLGYEAGGAPAATYGVSWFVSDAERGLAAAVGEVRNSRFHHNFHGVYLSGTRAVRLASSSFYDNIGYGIDLFGGTKNIQIVNNRMYRNGQHGIVLAQDADGNELSRNLILSNGRHGIVLHEGSDKNLVSNNRLEHNRDGIVIQRSNNNVLRQNTLDRHARGIRVTHAAQNLLLTNTIVDSQRAAVYFDTSPTEITYGKNNTLQGNGSAQRLYVDII